MMEDQMTRVQLFTAQQILEDWRVAAELFCANNHSFIEYADATAYTFVTLQGRKPISEPIIEDGLFPYADPCLSDILHKARKENCDKPELPILNNKCIFSGYVRFVDAAAGLIICGLSQRWLDDNHENRSLHRRISKKVDQLVCC